MKKNIIFVCIFTFLSFSCSAGKSEEFIVRNVQWDYSKEQVIQSEGLPPREIQGDILVYDGSLKNYTFTVLYGFDSNLKLDSIIFTNLDKYNTKVNEVLPLLLNEYTGKYGEPFRPTDNYYMWSVDDAMISIDVIRDVINIIYGKPNTK